MTRSLFYVTIGAIIFGAQAFGQIVVVPNANTTVVGGDTSGNLAGASGSYEIQEIFGNGQMPPTPITITGFAWRAVPGTGPVSVTVTGAIYLSSSPNYPNNASGHTLISTTFAANVGADNTLVASPSSFVITDPACPVSGTTPCQFGPPIPLTPFYFNPANGRLLMDLKLTSVTGTSGQWDVQDCPSSTNCTANGIAVSPLGTATAPAVQFSSNVTEFTYTASGVSATPVPASILLTLAGLACVAFFAARRGWKLA